MGRPRRVRETTGKEFRSDRELVYQFQNELAKSQRARIDFNKQRAQDKAMEAAYELWEKYFKLRMKMRAELAALCRRNDIYYPELYEEYDSEAWQKFIEQMPGVRLEDVEHITSWSIYIRLWGYWRSMNRDLVKRWLNYHDSKNVVSIYSVSKEDDSGLTNLDIDVSKKGDPISRNLELETNRQLFWDSINCLRLELTDKQKQLLNMKASGKKNREIMSTLQINGRILNENLAFIKQRLNVIITEVAKKKGMEANYSELLSSFGGEC